MPTIGEVYNPLIAAAKADDPTGHTLLAEVGRMIFENNPEQCPSLEDGIAAAKKKGFAGNGGDFNCIGMKLTRNDLTDFTACGITSSRSEWIIFTSFS